MAKKQISSLYYWEEDLIGENTRSALRMAAAVYMPEMQAVVAVVASSLEEEAKDLLELLTKTGTRVCQCTYQAIDLLLAASAEWP